MLNNILNNDKKPHAILLIENKYVNIDKYWKKYVKSLVCNSKKPYCNCCIYCKKVDQNQYFDLVFLNGFNQRILKENITNIINQFSKTGMESINKKIYVIRGVENLSKESANALLKFLEEPYSNIYAVLTAKNPDLVLPTIRSRCQIFYLSKNNDDNAVELLVKKYHLNDEQKDGLLSSCTSIDDMELYLNNNNFFDDYDFAKALISSKDLGVIKKLSESFRKKDYSEIQKLINLILGILPNKKTSLLKTIEKCQFQVSKILIFDEIWEVIKN